MSQPPIDQPTATMYDMLVKCIFDSQNNINILIGMQNQQMIYINTLLKTIRIDTTIPTTTTETQGQNNEQQQTNKTFNPKSFTKKNKDISGKTRQNKQKI